MRFVAAAGMGLVVAAAVAAGIFMARPHIEAFVVDTAKKGHVAFHRLQAARRGSVAPEDLRQLLLDSSDPRLHVFKVLANKEPKVFDGLVQYMSDNLGTRDMNAFAAAGRAYLMKEIAQPKAKLLSDADLTAMMQHTRDLSQELVASNPSICLAIAMGRTFGNIKPFISEAALMRDFEILIKMIEAEQRDVAFASAEELHLLNAKIGLKLAETHSPEDLALLDPTQVPSGREADGCRMMVAYIDQLLDLPERERVAIIRAMVGKPELFDQPVTSRPESEAPHSEKASAAAP